MKCCHEKSMPGTGKVKYKTDEDLSELYSCRLKRYKRHIEAFSIIRCHHWNLQIIYQSTINKF